MVDTGIPKMDIPHKTEVLSVLSQLFTIRGGSNKKAWGRKRQYFSSLAGTALQSVEPRGYRFCARGLENCISRFDQDYQEKG